MKGVCVDISFVCHYQGRLSSGGLSQKKKKDGIPFSISIKTGDVPFLGGEEGQNVPAEKGWIHMIGFTF